MSEWVVIHQHGNPKSKLLRLALKTSGLARLSRLLSPKMVSNNCLFLTCSFYRLDGHTDE